MIVAIDGPAASGKGTIGKRLANELDFAFLDTGLLYRAAAKTVLKKNLSPFNTQQVIEAVRHLTIDNLCTEGLRTQEISNLTPHVAGIPEVRDILGTVQRQFAHHPPGQKRGAILDGRDIGTVICPDADVKLFITASIYARAKRRYRELLASGYRTSFQAVHRDLRRRDQQDASRSASPLKPADDAIILDTTDLSVEEAYKQAFAIVTAQATIQNGG